MAGAKVSDEFCSGKMIGNISNHKYSTMKTFRDIPLENILFIDIETVPAYPGLDYLPENWKKLWEAKSKWLRKESDDEPAVLYHRAGIYAEFGKVICIGAGHFKDGSFRLTSYHGDDEMQLLDDFGLMLSRIFSRKNQYLCAHNGKEFDFPYLARRMLINSVKLPAVLDTAGCKPWEVPYLDTMDLWRFGDYKNYTSLDLLTTALGIPSPKSDVTGADVWRLYWQEQDLARISAYCREDVLAVARVYLAFQQVQHDRQFEVLVQDL